MSQGPRHINTDRSLNRPTEQRPTEASALHQVSLSGQPDFFQNEQPAPQQPEPPRQSAGGGRGGNGGSRPPRHAAPTDAPRRRKKKKKTPVWLPMAVTLAVLAVITQFYTAFQNNLWVAAAMRGIRAAIVPIMISAVLGMVGSAFRYPPCYAVMLLVIALYLFFNVNCVYLVVIGAVCGLLIAEFYERKGDKKHDGAA